MTQDRGKRLPPAAVCTGCGTYAVAATQMGLACRRQLSPQKKCKGTYRSALNTTDWKPCNYCDGVGCETCQRSGFLYVRDQRL